MGKELVRYFRSEDDLRKPEYLTEAQFSNVKKAFRQRAKKVGRCWEWHGTLNRHGYGRYSHYMAHRLSWEMTRGPIPVHLVIDHICRNRRCIAPSHLRLIPPFQNLLIGLSGGYLFQSALLGGENRTVWPSCPIDGRLA